MKPNFSKKKQQIRGDERSLKTGKVRASKSRGTIIVPLETTNWPIIFGLPDGGRGSTSLYIGANIFAVM
jgi:hypothetical protein